MGPNDTRKLGSDLGPVEKLGSNLGPVSAEHPLQPYNKTQNQAKRFNKLDHRSCFGTSDRLKLPLSFQQLTTRLESISGPVARKIVLLSSNVAQVPRWWRFQGLGLLEVTSTPRN
jgi:hypothetical protein